MRGSALLTTVLDSMATNIASSRPLRASRIWRCVIWPASSADDGTDVAAEGAAAAGATVSRWVTDARFMSGKRLLTATIFLTPHDHQPMRPPPRSTVRSPDRAPPTRPHHGPDMKRPAGVASGTRPPPADVMAGSPAGRVTAWDSPAASRALLPPMLLGC